MAKLNRNITPSPTAQASRDQNLSGSDICAVILNSARKSAPKRHKLKNASTIPSGSKSIAEKAQDPISKRGETNGNNNLKGEISSAAAGGPINEQSPAQTEAAGQNTFSGETAVQIPLKRKRQPEPEKDVYDFPSDTDVEKESEPYLPKRIKNAVGQKTRVKNNKNQTKTTPQTRSKNKVVPPKKIDHPSPNQTPSQPANTGVTLPSTGVQGKRSRGRPPGKKRLVNDRATKANEAQHDESRKVAMVLIDSNHLSEASDEEPDVSVGGVTTILEDPTIVEVTSQAQKSGRKTPTPSMASNNEDAGEEGRPLPKKNLATASSSTKETRPSDVVSEGNEGSAGDGDSGSDGESEGEDESEVSSSLASKISNDDLELANKILEKLNQVGKKYDSEKKEYILKEKKETEEEKMRSASGKHLYKHLKALRDVYNDMRSHWQDDDRELFENSQKTSDALITQITTEVSRAIQVLQLRHNPEKAPEKKMRLLKDLYFNILPLFATVLEKSIKLYSDMYDGEFSTRELEKLDSLLSPILNVAQIAKDASKGLDLSSSRGSYAIKQPTRSAIPLLSRLQENWHQRINAIERAKMQEEFQKAAAYHERKRREKEVEEQRLEKEERRQRRAAELKTQQAILAEKQAQLKARASISLLRKAPSKARLQHFIGQRAYAEEQLRISKSRFEDALRRLNELDVDDDDEQNVSRERQFLEKEVFTTERRFSDARKRVKDLKKQELDERHRLSEVEPTAGGTSEEGEDEGHAMERVHVFPKNNTSQHSKPRPWSNNEKWIFINTLAKSSKNPNKYQILARKLDRSLDEIFEQVKDFKEAMNMLYEQGKVIEPCDDWIEDIQIDR